MEIDILKSFLTTLIRYPAIITKPYFAIAFCLSIGISLLVPGCNPRQGEYKYTNPDRIIGSLSWEIVEAATKQTLDKKFISVRVKDVKISEDVSLGKSREEPHFQKSVLLNQDFYFSIHEFPETSINNRGGFGLTISRRDPVTFCWEWFDIEIDNDRYATKLQGTGKLMYRTRDGRKEITLIEFVSDVTFRVSIVSSDSPQDNPKWLVTIFKGSRITWPSLVEGIIVPND